MSLIFLTNARNQIWRFTVINYFFKWWKIPIIPSSLFDTTETTYLWMELVFHSQFNMFIFLCWSDQLRSFIWLNMSLKYTKIWLNSCDSNSSTRSQWCSSRKTPICSRSLKMWVKTPTWMPADFWVESKSVCSLPRSSQSDLKEAVI